MDGPLADQRAPAYRIARYALTDGPRKRRRRAFCEMGQQIEPALSGRPGWALGTSDGEARSKPTNASQADKVAECEDGVLAEEVKRSADTSDITPSPSRMVCVVVKRFHAWRIVGPALILRPAPPCPRRQRSPLIRGHREYALGLSSEPAPHYSNIADEPNFGWAITRGLGRRDFPTDWGSRGSTMLQFAYQKRVALETTG